MRWTGHAACMEVTGKYIQNFSQKPEGRVPCRRSSHRWEDNIRMDLRGMGWEDAEWIHLVQDRDQWWALVNMVMNLWIP
jgi:ribosome biogenesis protein Nip4